MKFKNSPYKIRPEDLRGLKTFLVDYPEARAFLLYRGKERLMIDKIQCLPCTEFLSSLDPHKTLDEDI